MPSSRLSGFYQLNIAERTGIVQAWANLSADEAAILADGLQLAQADKMTENVIGRYALALSIGTNFLINGRDYLIPMVIEEPSVVAAVSFAAKLIRAGGGFRSGSTEPIMIGQVQLLEVPDLTVAKAAIQASSDEIIALANSQGRSVKAVGLEVRPLPKTPTGPMLIVHLLMNVRDAMGANAINTAAEAVAPLLAQLSGGRAGLRILSNLSDRRRAWAVGVIPANALAVSDLTGAQVVRAIVEANAFAVADPYRAATHNKGIMNGIDAVAIATGNDWRAIEAGAHAYAARSGEYSSLTDWRMNEDGDLEGLLNLPLAVGIVGGATRVHPTAKLALKILGVQSATELAEVMAAVGLAQNFAAMRALATEGIQKGHMALHARQVAIAAGAQGEAVDHIAAQMAREGQIRLARAQALLTEDGGRRTMKDKSCQQGKRIKIGARSEVEE